VKKRCPFVNLPDRGGGRWGEGLTVEKMPLCRWLEPLLVARIEFLEWTAENRLRHPRFAGIRSDKNARRRYARNDLIRGHSLKHIRLTKGPGGRRKGIAPVEAIVD
jgi:hypothetical protein